MFLIVKNVAKKKRKEPKDKYISLKEAARISGYSSDYIGQLIRSGKIWGKPVYTNIAWRTTAEEVLSYKHKKKKKEKKAGSALEDKFRLWVVKTKHLFSREIKVLKLFVETFRFAVPLIIILILSFSLLIGYFFSLSFDRYSSKDLQALERLKDSEKTLRY